MLKQKSITVKTASATLTLAEMGDVVVNVPEAATVTLPAADYGLWFNLISVGAGAVSVVYGGETLAELGQNEMALFLASGTAGWFIGRGGSGGGAEAFTTLTDTPDGYADAAGKTVRVNSDATALEFVTSRLILTAVLPADWLGISPPFTQTIAVPGVLASDNPHIAPDLTGLTAAQAAVWSAISRAETADGAITFTCLEHRPGAALNLIIEVLR